jgi:hypothetical protein
MSRLGRERKTIAVMVSLYCRDHHGDSAGSSVREGRPSREETTARVGLCSDCEALLAYAGHRLARCRFGQSKPTCAHCTVHCYERSRREQIRAVMRYSGPRMTARHPILALAHLVDAARSRRGPGGQ